MSRCLTRDLMVLATDEPENETEKDDGHTERLQGSRVLDEGDRGSVAGWSRLPGQRRDCAEPRQGALVGRRRHNLQDCCDAGAGGTAGSTRLRSTRAGASRAAQTSPCSSGITGSLARRRCNRAEPSVSTTARVTAVPLSRIASTRSPSSPLNVWCGWPDSASAQPGAAR